eukprot:gene3745-4094_t
MEDEAKDDVLDYSQEEAVCDDEDFDESEEVVEDEGIEESVLRDEEEEVEEVGEEEEAPLPLPTLLSDKTALQAILRQTLKEVEGLEEECTVLMEILLRKKFKTLSEARPLFTKDRRKRKSEGTPAARGSAKKAKSLSLLSSPPPPPAPTPSL